MSDRIVQQADLSRIEYHLDFINSRLSSIDQDIVTVDNNVKVVYSELEQLSRDFADFVNEQRFANRLGQAETKLVQIRQQLEKKYGHYDVVRRTTTGILQADDLGIIRKETINTATEEIMIETPNYWLAPCLVSMAAWIDNNKELSDIALKEALKRDDEKTSLFFGLVCRRAERKKSCVKWIKRYLENQSPEDLDRKTIVALDAYAGGLLGVDSEGLVSKEIEGWLDYLSEKPGFIEKQTSQWSDAINLRRRPVDSSEYVYLRKFSKTWPILEDILEGANLHAEILDYFTSIFDQNISNESIKKQLDEILNSLVTDFDDEELPLRMQERFEQFVVDYSGDESKAKHSMEVEKTALENNKDFTQLLTDAAMKPESSNSSVSTQKFAIALSKEWIIDAYNDIIAKNRMKIPNQIEINVDTFDDASIEGENEDELIFRFNNLVNQEKEQALSVVVLSSFDKFCLYGGGAIVFLGIISGFLRHWIVFVLLLILGIGGMFKYKSRVDYINKERARIESYYEEKRKNGIEIIRATVAEIVDFRSEFEEKDSESKDVLDFLEQISPEQYVRKISTTNRRIKI